MRGIHLELRQLRHFKAITDARSFVRAADHLHVAQSALSRLDDCSSSGTAAALRSLTLAWSYTVMQTRS
jgi:hypothetical protein